MAVAVVFLRTVPEEGEVFESLRHGNCPAETRQIVKFFRNVEFEIDRQRSGRKQRKCAPHREFRFVLRSVDRFGVDHESSIFRVEFRGGILALEVVETIKLKPAISGLAFIRVNEATDRVVVGCSTHKLLGRRIFNQVNPAEFP